jgi:AcrR family transcriptional regulator
MSIEETKPQARRAKRKPERPAAKDGIAKTAGVKTTAAKSPDPRRERIVRMAAPLFLKKGYDNVSIDEIIGVVGGSKATIYAWFGGKEGLFEAVVRQKCDDVTLKIDTDIRGTLEDQLTRIGRSFLEMVLTPPIMEFHRLMVSIGRTFPEAGRLFFEGGPVSAYSIVAEWIATHQKDGKLIGEDPYRLAVLYLDMLIGEHQLGWLTSMPRAARKDRIEETVRLSVKVFLRGIAR